MCFDGLLTTSKLQHWPLSIVRAPMPIQHIYFYSALECICMPMPVSLSQHIHKYNIYNIINRSYNDKLVAWLDKFRTNPVNCWTGIRCCSSSSWLSEHAARSASIICTATSSTTPLFPAEWVTPGTHINLIGSFTPLMQEVSLTLFERAKLVLGLC